MLQMFKFFSLSYAEFPSGTAEDRIRLVFALSVLIYKIFKFLGFLWNYGCFLAECLMCYGCSDVEEEKYYKRLIGRQQIFQAVVSTILCTKLTTHLKCTERPCIWLRHLLITCYYRKWVDAAAKRKITYIAYLSVKNALSTIFSENVRNSVF